MQSMFNSGKKGNWLVFKEKLHFRVITSEYSIENRAVCLLHRFPCPTMTSLSLLNEDMTPNRLHGH